MHSSIKFKYNFCTKYHASKTNAELKQYEINSTYKSFFYSRLNIEALKFALIAVYKREHSSGLVLLLLRSKGIEAYCFI